MSYLSTIRPITTGPLPTPHYGPTDTVDLSRLSSSSSASSRSGSTSPAAERMRQEERNRAAQSATPWIEIAPHRRRYLISDLLSVYAGLTAVLRPWGGEVNTARHLIGLSGLYTQIAGWHVPPSVKARGYFCPSGASLASSPSPLSRGIRSAGMQGFGCRECGEQVGFGASTTGLIFHPLPGASAHLGNPQAPATSVARGEKLASALSKSWVPVGYSASAPDGGKVTKDAVLLNWNDMLSLLRYLVPGGDSDEETIAHLEFEMTNLTANGYGYLALDHGQLAYDPSSAEFANLPWNMNDAPLWQYGPCGYFETPSRMSEASKWILHNLAVPMDQFDLVRFFDLSSGGNAAAYGNLGVRVTDDHACAAKAAAATAGYLTAHLPGLPGKSSIWRTVPGLRANWRFTTSSGALLSSTTRPFEHLLAELSGPDYTYCPASILYPMFRSAAVSGCQHESLWEEVKWPVLGAVAIAAIYGGAVLAGGSAAASGGGAAAVSEPGLAPGTLLTSAPVSGGVTAPTIGSSLVPITGASASTIPVGAVASGGGAALAAGGASSGGILGTVSSVGGALSTAAKAATGANGAATAVKALGQSGQQPQQPSSGGLFPLSSASSGSDLMPLLLLGGGALLLLFMT